MWRGRPRRLRGHTDREPFLNRSTLFATVSALMACLIGAVIIAATRPSSATAADTTVSRLQTQNDALRSQLRAERRLHERVTTTLRARVDDANTPDVGTVDHALRIAAATYGVPESRLRAVATCESTLNPAATNGPYVGLFQFGLPLWNSTPYGDMSRTDPYAASLAAAKKFSEGGSANWPVCGA